MKKLLILFASVVLLASCKKNEEQSTPDQTLPPATEVGKTIFGADDNKKVFALSAENGATKWERSYATYASRPIYYKGVVYVTAEDQLYALNATDGTTRWVTPKNLALFDADEPVMNNQMVYALGDDSNGDNFIFALDANNGTQKWKISNGASPNNISLVGNTLYCQGYDNTDGYAVWAIDANTGSRKWFYKVSGSFGNCTRFYNGVVYFTQYGSTTTVYAINANDGTLKWKKNFNIGGTNGIGAPVVDNNGVYFPAANKKIYALNLADGSTKWEFNLLDASFTNLIVKDNVVYATSYNADKNFYAINANNGTEKWKYTESAYFLSSFAISGTSIYAPNSNAKIYSLNIANGQKIWEVSRGTASIGSVVDANNNVSYFGQVDMQ